MIRPARFTQELRRVGIDFFTGVPCSFLGGWTDALAGGRDARYVPATNEGDALAIACGAELGGSGAAVFFQNSGLGNAVNPLTSLAVTFRIPVLLVITWRGDPEGPEDEPQHRLMGAITPAMLASIGVAWEPLSAREDDLPAALDAAAAHMREQRTPYALMVREGTFAGGATGPSRALGERSGGVPAVAPSPLPALDPDEALRRIAAASADGVLLATTGYTGRALYACGDRPNQLYMVGSMGCVSSLALGIALARPDRRVVAIDGDGAFLMRMGALAAVGRARPPNLAHALLDNGVHDSTGAQATLARSIDPAAVAGACGYPVVVRAASADELERAVRSAGKALTFVHARTEPRTGSSASRTLPRPAIGPPAVAQRLRAWLREA